MVVVIPIFAAARLDPELALFSWLTDLGTLGIILLMTITAFAVPAFFRRQPASGMSGLLAAAFPDLAGLAPLAVVMLAVVRFDALTNAFRTLSILVPALLLVVSAPSADLAAALRRRAPPRFLQPGRTRAA